LVALAAGAGGSNEPGRFAGSWVRWCAGSLVEPTHPRTWRTREPP